MELRDYQTEAIAELRKSLATGHNRPILVAPTGSGKTRIATEVVKMAASKGSKVLFLAPRRELIYQTVETFVHNNIRAGMIMAGEMPNRSFEMQVASKDTLHARAIQRDKIEMPEADLVIVDECHLSITKSWMDIINHYSKKRIIGLTATPARGDGKGLGEVYDDMVFASNVAELTEMGYLVPVRYFAPSEPDLSKVKQTASDYVIDSLAQAMDNNELIGDIYDNWARIAKERKTVVFCTTRAHSRHMCDEFRSHGVTADHLDGETPKEERKQILDRVRSGETQVLCNVFVATYGLDIPSLECAVLARPTKNISLYLQTIGRVLRPSPETKKADALVIDHSGAVKQHGFVDEPVPWTLDSKKDVRIAREEAQRDRKEPKEIKCPHCATMFKSRRTCPNCGFELIKPNEPIPCHEHDLEEIKRKQEKKDNRDWSNERKAEFYGGLLSWADARKYKRGWAAQVYKEKFGVWPNYYKDVQPCTPNTDVTGYIRHRNIKNAKRRERENTNADVQQVQAGGSGDIRTEPDMFGV